MTTQDTQRPRSIHGGRRPGAGAPRDNINALKLLNFSERYKDAAALISLIPQLRERWLDLREVADAPLKDGESPWRRRRARYHMKVMLDAAAEVISPSNHILGYVAEVARERLEPPTPWRVRKYALMALRQRAAPDERVTYIIVPLKMIRDDAPDLATLLLQPLLEDFERQEAALMEPKAEPPDLPLSSQACPEPGRRGEGAGGTRLTSPSPRKERGPGGEVSVVRRALAAGFIPQWPALQTIKLAPKTESTAKKPHE